MEEFQSGDTVRLKAGGPLMSVDKTGKDQFGEERVWCSWFESKGVRKQETFTPATLEKDED